MFCPECQAEYRSGFKTCSDCHVDLVETLPEGPRNSKETILDASYQEIWTGRSQEACVMFCSALREAEIPYQAFRHEIRAFADADGNYRIAVPPDFVDSARQIIEHGEPGNVEEDDPGAELAAQDDRPPPDADNEHRDWKEEAPDDATVEIASGSTRDVAAMVVLALRESDIESRTTTLPDGTRKIFVTPHDQSRAREIVREVESSDPPE
jgi:hypothetical protein